MTSLMGRLLGSGRNDTKGSVVEAGARHDDPTPLKLRIVPVGKVLRDLDDIPAKGLVVSQPITETGYAERHFVDLDPDAEVLFNREVLFAFRLEVPGSANSRPNLPLERIRLEVRLPLPLEKVCRPFFVAELQRPVMSPTDAEFRPCGRYKEKQDGADLSFEALVVVGRDYGFAVDLSAIDYQIKHLFGSFKHKSSIEINIKRVRSNRSSYAQICTVYVALGATSRRRLMVVNDVNYAIVLNSNAKAAKLYHVKNDNGTCNFRLVNISSFDFRIDARVALCTMACHEGTLSPGEETSLSFEANRDFEDRVLTVLTVKIDGAKGIRPERQAISLNVTLQVCTPLRHKTVGIDIGTSAITMALGGYDHRGPKVVPLGEIVERFLSGDLPRRERGNKDLIPSICGLTARSVRSEDNIDPYVAPFGAALGFDRRFDGLWEAKGIKAAVARICATKLPKDRETTDPPSIVEIDLHLPLTARKYERLDATRAGFLQIRSIKTQICTQSTLHFRDELTAKTEVLVGDINEKVGSKLARDVDTVAILKATLDTLLHPFLLQSGILPLGSGVPAEMTYVLTYPASISARAQERYKEALDFTAQRKQASLETPGREPCQKFSVMLMNEASAAAWALMDAAVPQLWPNADAEGNDDVVRRLILFDVGAGTLDVAAFDYAPGEHLAPIRQTVSFSMPCGGQSLDEAIARDLDKNLADNLLAPDENPSRTRLEPVRADLLDRIDIAKRYQRGALLPIVEGRIYQTAEEGPLLKDRFNDFDTGAAIDAREFASLDLGSDLRPKGWTVLDLNKPRPHLQAFQDLVREVIVPSTMCAANMTTMSQGERPVETAVVLSGRGSLFSPLQCAFREGISACLNGVKVFLGAHIVNPQAEVAEHAQLMKTLTVRGAVSWAQRTREQQLRLSSPSIRPDLLAAAFAILHGEWEADAGAFCKIIRIDDLIAGSNRIETDDEDAFLVMRPPLFTDAGKLKAFLRTPFGRSLVRRVIRPVVVDGRDRGAPLPLGSSIDVARISLARRNQRLTVLYDVQGNSLNLRIQNEAEGETSFELNLSSGFLDASDD